MSSVDAFAHSSPMRQQITRLRKAKNLTQVELAKLCGLSRQSINMLECDNTIPSLPNAYKLARALGVAIEQLYLPEEAGAPSEDVITNAYEDGTGRTTEDLLPAGYSSEASEIARNAKRQQASASQND